MSARQHIQTYQIYPFIPESLSFLEIFSRNLWWCWKPEAIELFRRIDPQLWESCGRNPMFLCANASQKRLEELANDDSFLAHQQRVGKLFEQRVSYHVDWERTPYEHQSAIAYFSMEFGIHESIPLAAGGLGILAGDHLKAALNMALPLVGVGLLYRKGYFRQLLDADGWQQDEYPETELCHLPIERARDEQGNEINVSVAGPDGDIHAVVWKLRIGRTPLFLLDTNVPENPPESREITARLYAGEHKIRLAQEVLLGIGGMRALAALGIFPSVCHMNEGHSAFSSLERLAQIMERCKVGIKTALEIIPRATVFTTHTPVAAGHDVFPQEMVRPFIRAFETRLGISSDEILAWGKSRGDEPNAQFSMFALGLRMAQHCNGVSQLHGKVARRMWASLWPGRPEEEIPISHVTNGVHISTWISPEIAMLFERYLGPEWYMSSRKPENIRRIGEIYDEELWRAHEMSRTRLIRTCRKLMVRQYERRNAPKSVISEVESVLEPDTLTIAFARRFATYKRASLLLQDQARLEAILCSSAHPVQLIFAGKAHPKDQEGKELIRKLVRFAKTPNIRNRVVFVEDYDMCLARLMVQGADVWLNTPRRPNEACGTSGMKAATNGVLDVSIMDGWWCEGYDQTRGWQLGKGEEYADTAYQDAVESQALYNILENEVIPCFYDRKNSDLPLRWISMMKESMKMAMRDFCSLRMVNDYEQRFYQPIAKRFRGLLENNCAEAETLAFRRERLRNLWKQVRIERPASGRKGPFRVGENFYVSALIHLGELRPDEVDAELYNGYMRSVDSLDAITVEPMEVREERGNGSYLYACTVPCRISGRYGFTVRVTPKGDDLVKFFARADHMVLSKMIKSRWKIRDIIDLEYFLSGYEPSDADRDMYLHRIKPLGDSDKSGRNRLPGFVIRQWLEFRRISAKETLGADVVLPGDAFDEIHQWLCWGLMFVGIMTGSGMAFSLLTYKGTEPLNVSVFLGVLVATQLLLLSFLLLILLTGMFRFARHKSLIYSFLGYMLSAAIMFFKDTAMKKLSAAHRDSLMAAIGLAKGRKTVYGTLFYWPLFMLAQLFGMGFNIGVLGATLLKVIGADIAFGWQSTVRLGSEVVYRIAELIALPWSWFVPPDVAHPTLAQIEGSRMVLKDGIWHLATSDLVSWWPFLCLAVLFYGFMPRLTLFFIALIGRNRSLRGLDFAHNPCDRLLRRMETPIVRVRSEIADTRRNHPQPEFPVSEIPSRIRSETSETVALIPEDIFGQCGEGGLEELILRNLGNYRIARKIGIGADQMADTNEIMKLGNANVLILQEAWQPPIKETLSFLEEIRKTIGKKTLIVLVLIGMPKPDTIFTPVKKQDYEIWRGKINALADPYLSVERLVSDEQ